jgi:hypothetical protein
MVWAVGVTLWRRNVVWSLLCLAAATEACGGRSARDGTEHGTPRDSAGQGGQSGHAALGGAGSAGTLGSAAETGIGGGVAGMSAGETATTWDLNQGSAEVRETCTDYCAYLDADCPARGDSCREGCILSGNHLVSCVDDFAAYIECLAAHIDPECEENCSGETRCDAEAHEACRSVEAQLFACQEACSPETIDSPNDCSIAWMCEGLRVSCAPGDESWDCSCSGYRPEEHRVTVTFDTFTPCKDAALRCQGF